MPSSPGSRSRCSGSARTSRCSRSSPGTRDLARTLAAALALAAVGFAAYLVMLQAFVIDAWCVWCLVNDLVFVPLLAVLTVWRVLRQTRADQVTSSEPGGGCSTGCGRGSPSGCRRWR